MKKYIILIILIALLPTSSAFSATDNESRFSSLPLNQYGIRSLDPYVSDRFFKNGLWIERIEVPGPPEPPLGYERSLVNKRERQGTRGSTGSLSVPALTWCFGCSATSAAMLFGYYDRNGYSSMYTGPTNGGVFPLTNATWGTASINGQTQALCPLSATRLDLDGRTTYGHVNDYWVKYGNRDPDPFIENWTEHSQNDCTGDYMGTNQSQLDNSDGSTTFYNYTNGAPLSDYTGCEPSRRDGCHGLRLFAESRGYTVVTNYNQYIYGYDGNTSGFTFSQFQAEIDGGYPVLIHVIGHTMIGYGYDDSTSPPTIYIHDTWDYNDHTMEWGGSYSGMDHRSVTVLHLQLAETVYASKSNQTCNGHSECKQTIDDAYISSRDCYEIKMTNETYPEGDLLFNRDIRISLSGSWNDNYDSTGQPTTIEGSLTISAGTVTIEGVVITGTGSLAQTDELYFGSRFPKYCLLTDNRFIGEIH